MKRTLFGGFALALAAFVAVYIGDALNLGLPNPLLGVPVGGVLALAPGGQKLGRYIGFLIGVTIALVGTAINAQFMPASSSGVAVTAALTLVLVTGAAALSFGRFPLWSLLLGVGGFAGAYDYVYNDAPYNFLNTSTLALGTFMVLANIGYLTGALIDWLFPEDSDDAEPEGAQEPETVGSEI
jgi:hypothetical protein